MAILSKSGFPSKRNLDKPFRPQRVNPDGSVHWQDNMRLGNEGQAVNSTGRFGTVTTFSIRVKTFGPQKGKRRSAKRKNPPQMCSTKDIRLADQRSIEALVVLRSQLLTLQAIGDFQGREILDRNLMTALIKISASLRSRMRHFELKELYAKEEQKYNSLMGRLRSQGVNSVKLGNIRSQVEHTLRNL